MAAVRCRPCPAAKEQESDYEQQPAQADPGVGIAVAVEYVDAHAFNPFHPEHLDALYTEEERIQSLWMCMLWVTKHTQMQGVQGLRGALHAIIGHPGLLDRLMQYPVLPEVVAAVDGYVTALLDAIEECPTVGDAVPILPNLYISGDVVALDYQPSHVAVNATVRACNRYLFGSFGVEVFRP